MFYHLSPISSFLFAIYLDQNDDESFCFQNKRGGKVKLNSILMPLSEFDHEEKGDALYGKFCISLLCALNVHL